MTSTRDTTHPNDLSDAPGKTFHRARWPEAEHRWCFDNRVVAIHVS
jgi:hypothetical protein